MVTLFAEPPRSSHFPVSYAASIVLHGCLLSLVTFKVISAHRVIERVRLDRFAVRLLDFHSTEPQARQSLAGGISYPGPFPGPQPGRPAGAHTSISEGSSARSPIRTRQTPPLLPAPQTLIQPDLPRDLSAFKKIPVPLVVLWSPEKIEMKKRIVPPLPDKPAIAVVHPSLDTPPKEENLADLRIASTAFVTHTPAAPPSTTSPIVVHGPEEAKKVPQTTSKPPEPQPPTPARVISLSDVRVAQGSVAVPAANQTSAKDAPGTTVPGVLKNPSAAGVGKSASAKSGTGAGKGSGDQAGKDRNAAVAHGSAEGTGTGVNRSAAAGQGAGQANTNAIAQSGAAAGPVQGPAAGPGSSARPGTVHISLPRDGQFGVVVVGISIADSYPETAELWSGRMASTVYLHLGLAKSWILQYTLPRPVEAATGGGGRLEAPWPYEMLRPDLDRSDPNAEAVILHGFVNRDGRFDKLEVVFPAQFVQAPMVLNVLNEWQFRPAKQNGQDTAVEVLLIIPDRVQ